MKAASRPRIQAKTQKNDHTKNTTSTSNQIRWARNSSSSLVGRGNGDVFCLASSIFIRHTLMTGGWVGNIDPAVVASGLRKSQIQIEKSKRISLQRFSSRKRHPEPKCRFEFKKSGFNGCFGANTGPFGSHKRSLQPLNSERKWFAKLLCRNRSI